MIGEEVRRHRTELGLTGAQLAARAGMAPSAVSQIETGKRTPSSTSVIKLADALGVEVAALLPKAQAPLPLQDREAGAEKLSDISQEQFLRALSSASSDKALIELYRRIDAERTHLELAWQDDESNRTARSAFLRAMQRRMVVLLTLVERGVALSDPEKASLANQAAQLENLWSS